MSYGFFAQEAAQSRPKRIEHVIGLCLGRPFEHTGLAVLEVAWTEGVTDRDTRMFTVLDLRRFEAGTSYDAIAADVASLVQSSPLHRKERRYRPSALYQSTTIAYEVERFPTLVVDRTGAGEPAADLLRRAMPDAVSAFDFVLTAADADSRGQGVTRYPRRDLASLLQLVVQQKRIKVAPTLKYAKTLQEEMRHFKQRRISLSAKDEDLAWRERPDEDLVLAVASAVWSSRGIGPVIDEEAARLLMGIGRDFRPWQG